MTKNDKTIVWLASYPKSGNTWTRAFLINYILNTDKPVPINELSKYALSDSWASHYEKINQGPIERLPEERILDLRTRFLTGVARNGADMNFVKTHNLNYKIMGRAMIPPPLTRHVISIVRNPLAVVPSYAKHYGQTLERSVKNIANKLNSSKTTTENVKDYLGSWSDHVESWTKTRAFPVHVIRYEDMTDQPEETFGTLIRKLGLPLEKDRLERSIRNSSFKELKRQEQTEGFLEQSKSSDSFFRSGKVDSWKDELSPELIAQVRQDHGKVMQRFGYF